MTSISQNFVLKEVSITESFETTQGDICLWDTQLAYCFNGKSTWYIHFSLEIFVRNKKQCCI